MKLNLYILLISLFAAGSAQHGYGQQALECSTLPANSEKWDDHLVKPGSAEESARFKQAPHGARRLQQHALEIGWAGGKLALKDKPPYNDFDSVHWTYCGYNESLKLHMVLKDGDGAWTGALIDDTTGTVLPGGQKVLFSKSASFYLTYSQDDGRDGKTLKLYRRDGKLLWDGFDGLLTPDGIYQTAYFEKMQWDDQERPQAVAHDIKSGNLQTVTLKQNGSNQWEWSSGVSK
jgi:hypothetical protein